MQAIEVARFGGPDVLKPTEVPDPQPQPGELLVDVAAAGVLFVDTAIRSGDAQELFPVDPPYIPGRGVAGVVSAAGSGVDDSWRGRTVVADVDNGGYAERVAADPARTFVLPEGVSAEQAAALIHDGSTALLVAEGSDIRAGETVLVQPAAGGLGSILVQLAHNAGATVVAAARGEEKGKIARELGADIVVDYGVEGWTAQIPQVDVAFTGVGGELGRAAFEQVKPGGRFSNYGVAGGGPTVIDPAEATERDVSVRGMEQLGQGADRRFERIARVLQLAADGKVRALTRSFPLADAARAHEALVNRQVIGKALLVP